MLGGNAEFLAVQELEEARASTPTENPEDYEAALGRGLRAEVKAVVAEEARRGHRGRRALRARHRASRIAPHRQSAARSFWSSGRPGREPLLPLAHRTTSCAVHVAVAAEALLRRRLRRRRAHRIRPHAHRRDRNAQAQIESRNAEIRKNVLKYDDVLNRQRQTIYAERSQILDGDDLDEHVQHFIDEVDHRHRREHTARGNTRETGISMRSGPSLKTLYPVSVTIDEVVARRRGAQGRIPEGGLTR